MHIEPQIIISYLETLGVLKSIGFEPSGEDTFRICCPYHDDKKPSGTIYTNDKFICRAASCGKRTDTVSLLARITEVTLKQACTREQMIALLVRKYNLSAPDDAPLAIEPIMLAHGAIDTTNPIIAAFKKKGVSAESIRKYKIGFGEGRIWIPIPNIAETCFVNVRKYLPDAPGPDKMRNVKGRSVPKLFPPDQLSYRHIAICGGECKALVAAQELNRHDIGAVCVTGSEGTWRMEFNEEFRNKVVYIIMDIDDGGRTAAAKVARMVYKTAADVKIVVLPFPEPEKFPKGDVNNFVVDVGGDLLHALQTSSIDYAPKQGANDALQDLFLGDYTRRSISGAICAAQLGNRSKISASIVGISEERYSLPSVVRVSCNMDTEHCVMCNVYGRKEEPNFAVPPEHPALIAMCGSSNANLKAYIRRDIIGIPEKCKAHMLVVTERTAGELVVVSQPVGLESTTEADTRQVQKVLAIGDGVELNESYDFEVRSQPDPSTQETVLIASAGVKIANCLDSVEIDNSEGLDVFRPDDFSLESLQHKLAEISQDLACNVTKIFERPELHQVIDLMYHSPLYITLDKAPVKGWVEALVIGDSGQGKSEAARLMSKHYGLGHSIDCANVSTAGLIGGNQQLAGMWVITWGAFPANDRKALILEELKRAPVPIIASITEMRSSGIARIDKIRAGRRPARVRLLALSNARSDRFLRTYGSGVDAVLELIGNPEDVRRFDVCYCMSADDLAGDVVHSTNRPIVPHNITAPLCHKLLTWVWTRTAKDVVISDTVRDVLYAISSELSGQYSDTIPIVDRGTIRLKLIRLATSIACRTYSTTDGQSVDVQARHIQSAVAFLRHIYDSRAMGYRSYSDKQFSVAAMNDKNAKAVIAAIQGLPYPKQVAEHLRTKTFINDKELQYLAGTGPEDIRSFLALLTRSGSIEFKGSNMIITGALRELINSAPSDTFQESKINETF